MGVAFVLLAPPTPGRSQRLITLGPECGIVRLRAKGWNQNPKRPCLNGLVDSSAARRGKLDRPVMGSSDGPGPVDQFS